MGRKKRTRERSLKGWTLSSSTSFTFCELFLLFVFFFSAEKYEETGLRFLITRLFLSGPEESQLDGFFLDSVPSCPSLPVGIRALRYPI